MSPHETDTSYGAAGGEADSVAQHFVAKGRALRSRKLSLLLLAVAAVSCSCAVIFVATQNRSELFGAWSPSDDPITATKYAWGGLKPYHDAVQDAYSGGVPAASTLPYPYALDDAKSYLGAAGLQAYEDAIRSAHLSHQDMVDLMTHYRNPATLPSEAIPTLRAAEEAWQNRHKTLERLNSEIEHESKRIHTLEEDEQALLEHHSRAASYVSSLLVSSKGISAQLKELRQFYVDQLHSTAMKLEDAVYERKRQQHKLKLALDAKQEQADQYNAQVSKSIAQASYYDGQVEVAKAQERTMRDRADAAEGRARASKSILGVAVTKALDEKVREKAALAVESDAQLKANAIEKTTRQKQEASDDLYQAKAKLLEAEAVAKGDVAEAEAAKAKVEQARAEEVEERKRLSALDSQLDTVMDSIIDERTRAKTAEVRATLYAQRTEEAQKELDAALAQEADMSEQVKAALLAVEEAEGQAALAKTEAGLAEQSSKEAIAEAREKAALAARATREGGEAAARARARLQVAAQNKEAALEEQVVKQGAAVDAQNALTVAQERAAAAKAYADAVSAEVDEKKAAAASLLETVKGLTEAAQQSAILAKAARAAAPTRPPPIFIGVPQSSALPQPDVPPVPCLAANGCNEQAL